MFEWVLGVENDIYHKVLYSLLYLEMWEGV